MGETEPKGTIETEIGFWFNTKPRIGSQIIVVRSLDVPPGIYEFVPPGIYERVGPQILLRVSPQVSLHPSREAEKEECENNHPESRDDSED